MTALSERSPVTLGLILTLLGGAVAIVAALGGIAWRQETRANDIDISVALVARDVAEVKAQLTEVKIALRDQVTVAAMDGWIRLNNAANPNLHLTGFRTP